MNVSRWTRLRSRCHFYRRDGGVGAGFLAPFFYIGRGSPLTGGLFYFRLWSNGPGLHIRRRPYYLLFSERNGHTRVHLWGAFAWKVLK